MPETIPFLDSSPAATAALGAAQVLYTDMDGTLLGPGGCLVCDDGGAPSLDAATGVTMLNSAGLAVVPTSGRNARQLLEISRMLGWRDFIGELGCVVCYDRCARKIYATGAWPEGTVAEGDTPYAVIERSGAFEALDEAFPGRIEYHDPWHRDREVTHMLRGNVPAAEAAHVLAGVGVAVDLVDNGIIHPPRTTLQGVTEVHAYHLVPAGVSKAAAVKADIARRGLGADHAIAVGDSAADIEMASVTALMVIVRNGLDDPALIAGAAGLTNVVATRGRRGTGWRELAEAWLAARQLG